MRNVFRIVLAVLLLASAAAARAQAVGRVLVSAGEVVMHRAGREIPVAAGTQVEVGDRLRTGGASNVQILFTDGGVVAVRPKSEFAIEEYTYTGRQDGSEKLVFHLVTGGLRAFTGLIGRLNPKNYLMRTRYMSLGVRGTNYALIDCLGQCLNRDGTLAADGVYGGVTEGRVAVTPVAKIDAERQFAAGEYFLVANEYTPARRLIEPPPFLSDKLDGQYSQKNRGGGATTSAADRSGNTRNTTSSNSVAGGTTGPTTTVTDVSGKTGDATTSSTATTAAGGTTIAADDSGKASDTTTTSTAATATDVSGKASDTTTGSTATSGGSGSTTGATTSTSGSTPGGSGSTTTTTTSTSGSTPGGSGSTPGGTTTSTSGSTPGGSGLAGTGGTSGITVSTTPQSSGAVNALSVSQTGFISPYFSSATVTAVVDCPIGGSCNASTVVINGKTIVTGGAEIGDLVVDPPSGSNLPVSIGAFTYGWGRWSGPSSITSAAGTTSNLPLLYAYTNASPLFAAPPGSGANVLVSYSFQGGTAVDAAGNSGSISTALNATFGNVNFTTGAITLNTGVQFGGNKYSIRGAGSLTSGASLIGGALSWCAGNGCVPVAPTGTSTGSFDARFFGSTATQAVIVNGTLKATPSNGTVLFLGVGKF
jgi:hypothetical protein